MTPLTLNQAMQEALRHHQAGRFPQAEALYRQVLQVNPRHPDALHLLGVLAHQSGQPAAALDLIAQAIRQSPFLGSYYNSYGEALRVLGRFNEAVAAFQNAVSRQPRFPEAWSNLGLALDALRRPADSEAAFRQALALDPNFADAHNNLGTLLTHLGRFDEGLAEHHRAVALNPQSPAAWNNLGVALETIGDTEASIAAYRRATEVNPNQAESFHNIGVPLIKLNRIAEAKAAWQRALELRPNYSDAHFNLGLALLLEGNLLQGFAEHEWRWQVPSLPRSRGFTQPQWDGSNLAGRTVLLYAEQGYGDTFQFIRYAPLVAAQGGRVLLDCPPDLLDLMRTVPGITQFIPAGAPLPHFDFQIPLLSLPFALRTTLDTIPNQVPYLRVDDAHLETWRARLAATPSDDKSNDGKLKIGIAWQGRPSHKDDKNRSCPLAAFAPLAALSNITLYSLQKGPAAEQTKNPPAGLQIIDLTEHLADFSDTAAFITHLDLVIAVDTAVVHLAGALARPVWTLIPFAPEWRWMMDRTDSPWYPTIKLFRQKTRGNWPEVLTRIAQELSTLHR